MPYLLVFFPLLLFLDFLPISVSEGFLSKIAKIFNESTHFHSLSLNSFTDAGFHLWTLDKPVASPQTGKRGSVP